MENTKRRRSGRLGRLITAVFALAFVASIISTITAFAAANLFKIQNAELSELSTTAEGSISSFDETNIVSNVTFHKLNDSAKYTITLKNTDSKDHVIESITDDNESPYISYIYDQHANEQINAGENLVFEVTAKYTTAITDINQRAQATNVKFFIHFTDLEEEIPIVPNTGVNPNTGDYIHFSVLSLVISAAGLTIIGIIALKKHKKASKFIAAGIVTVAAIATTATVKAATVEINSFTINTNFALKSKLIVTYKDGEGNSHEVVVDYNEPTTIEDQQKDGYTFTGWEDENGNPVDLSQPITDDITIKPVFTKNGYSIVFDENQGEGSMANLSMVYDEAKQLAKNTFTRTGYTFTSWNTDAEGNDTSYTDEQEVSNLTKEKDGSVTLYAQWSPIHYTINFNGNGATEGSMSSISAEYDKDAQLPAGGFTRTGYTQNGWKNGADSIADQATVKNLASTEGATVTLDAVWEANPYTIHFDANAPSQSTPQGFMSDITAHYDTPETLSYNMFTILGYAFDSWNTKADGTGMKIVNGAEVKNLATEGTVNLYAQWAVTPYTVVFHKNADDATGDMVNQQIAYNQPADLNELGFTRTGFNFANWATNTDGSGDTFADKQRVINLDIDGTVDLYAQWTPKEYTISFNVNTDDPEATGTMSDQTVVYGAQTSLNELGFTRTGYAFDSWNTEADGSGTKYEDKQDVSNTISDTNITLYAQWAVTPYIVIFNKNADDVTGSMDNQQIAYGEQVALTKNTYAKEHYKFMGWNTQADGQGTHYDDEQLVKNLDIDGEVNLYAEWIELTSTLNTGSNINRILKNINANATEFKNYIGTPNFDNIDGEQMISLDNSNFPTYAWNDNGTIYWWSEVDDVYMNSDSSQIFMGMNKIERVNFKGLTTSTVVNMAEMFRDCSSLVDVDFDNFDTSNVESMWRLFWNCTSIEELDLSNFNTSKVTRMSSMFLNCSNLKELDLSNFDTHGVSSLASIFQDTSSLTKLNISNWDFSNVTNFGYWISRSALQEINVSNGIGAVDMTGVFSNINANKIDLTNFDASNTKNMSQLFMNSANLSNIILTGINTTGVEDMSSMFNGCTSLTDIDISSFNTSKVTNMSYMFNNTGLTSIDFGPNFKTGEVTNMEGMFRLSPITSLDVTGFNTQKVTNMRTMFNRIKVTELDLSSWDTNNVENVGFMFYGNPQLTTIYVSESFVNTNMSDPDGSNPMFDLCTGLVGGSGTTYDVSHRTIEYARIDDPDNGNPGYFTNIADKPVEP